MLTQWLTAQLSPQAPGFWLLISFMATALLLALQPFLPRRYRNSIWFAHWLLIPYLGLLLGGLSPRLLGLSAIDWLASLGLGLGLIFAIAVLLVLVRAVVDLEEATPLALLRGWRPVREQLAATQATLFSWQTLTSATLWSGIEQFHWVFLRGSLWELLLNLPQPPELVGYWAIWLAAAIIVVELVWLRPSFMVLLIELAALMTTSILFFYTRNFWLCWILHATVQLLLAPPVLLPIVPVRLAEQQ